MLLNLKPTELMILSDIKRDLKAGKNVVVNCSSQTLATKIREMALTEGIKTAIYTGEGDKVINQFGEELSIGNHKKIQL